MASTRFDITHDLFQMTGTTDEDQIKLFVDIEVLSRKQEITLKLLERLLLEHVADDLLDRGILKDITKILLDHDRIEKRRIAKGTLPKKGIDGKLVFVKRKLSRDPKIETIDAQGSVSLKELGLFENIRSGEPVVRVYPPKQGKSGMTVSGLEIPGPMGETVQVLLDDATLERESAEVSGASYDSIKSKVDGYLEQQGSKLTMREEFVVTGNLDGEYGSIAFIGTVLIKGDVLAGYQVAGDKGVTIGGNVNKTVVTSQYGPILIKGRFFGEGQGKLISSRTVSVRSIQDGTIDAVQDITVEEEARASTIRTCATLQASRATLIGGHCFTVKGAVVGELGSSSDVTTTLLLGSDVEVSEEYQKLLLRIAQHQKAVELLTAHLGPYAKSPARIKLLNEKLKTKLEALFAKREKVAGSLEVLIKKQSDLLDSANIDEKIYLSIEKNFFPGGILRAGEASYQTNEPKKGPFSICYQTETGELVEEEYVSVTPIAEED